MEGVKSSFEFWVLSFEFVSDFGI